MALSKFSPQQLVDLSEQLSSNDNQDGMDKLFEQIEIEENFNEFGVSQVGKSLTRSEKLTQMKKSLIKYDINRTNSIRVVERKDKSATHASSYF